MSASNRARNAGRDEGSRQGEPGAADPETLEGRSKDSMAILNTTTPAARVHRGAWLWAAIAAASCASMICLEPSLLEEGLLLHFAERMAAGEHLYRDLIYFSGPLPFELLAALFRTLGAEIVVGRLALVVLHAVATAATFGLARRAHAGSAAHVAAAGWAAAPVLLFPLYSTYFYTTLALHFCVLAAYSAVRGFESRRWAALAGVLLACAALSKQNLGALAAAATLITLATAPGDRRARGARIGWLLLGGAAAAAATVLLFAIRGDLDALVAQTVWMPLSLESSYASGFVNLWPPGRFDAAVEPIEAFYLPHLYNILTGQSGRAPAWIVLLTQALYALPFLAAALPVIGRLRRRAVPHAVWVHEALLVALILNLFPRTDWGHLVFVLPVALAQVSLVAGSLRRSPDAAVGGGALARTLSATAVAVLAAGSIAGAVALHREAGPPSFGPRVPQAPVSRATKSRGVPRVIEFLRERTEPGEFVFVARAEPLVYFATDTRNPTPYGGVLPTQRREQERTITRALDDVRFVVMSEIDQPLFLYYRDELPAVQRLLERHFRVAEPFAQRPSWIIVLERGPDRGPAVVDLFDARATGRRFVIDREGNERAPGRSAPELASRQNRRPLATVLGVGGGGIDFEIAVPPRAIFEAGVGLRAVPGPSGPEQHADALELQVLARVGNGAGPFALLASEPVRFGPGSGTTWKPLEADLSAFAGQDVTLRLQAVPLANGRPGSLAWWGSPRLTQRSER